MDRNKVNPRAPDATIEGEDFLTHANDRPCCNVDSVRLER